MLSSDSKSCIGNTANTRKQQMTIHSLFIIDRHSVSPIDLSIKTQTLFVINGNISGNDI